MARNRIQRFIETLVLDFGADDNQIISGNISVNGLLHGITLVVPNLEDTNTVTITLKDADGTVLFTLAAIAESATKVILVDANNHPLRIPLSGVHTVELLTSAAQTANRTFELVLLIARGF